MSRNQREGRYIGHGYGRPVRQRALHPRVCAALARAYLRGRLFKRTYPAPTRRHLILSVLRRGALTVTRLGEQGAR